MHGVPPAAEIPWTLIFFRARTRPLRQRGRCECQQDHICPLIVETMRRIYRERRTRASLSDARDHERAFAVGLAVGPALGHDLVLGPEAQALHAVLADVAEA